MFSPSRKPSSRRIAPVGGAQPDSAMRILVVEDDAKVARFLEQTLREEGYAVDVASNGTEGLKLARIHDYDLCLLDVMLPGRSGLEVARALRTAEMDVPILMLTARDSVGDVVAGLDAGADDYLTKPFSLEELWARVRALLRRGGARRTELLEYADVRLDRLRHQAYRAERPLDLTPREFALLEYFLLRPGEVVRRSELLEKVWDLSSDPMSNVVDVHVANLRRKLREGGEEDLLHTVRGVGYMLEMRRREGWGPDGLWGTSGI